MSRRPLYRQGVSAIFSDVWTDVISCSFAWLEKLTAALRHDICHDYVMEGRRYAAGSLGYLNVFAASLWSGISAIL